MEKVLIAIIVVLVILIGLRLCWCNMGNSTVNGNNIVNGGNIPPTCGVIIYQHPELSCGSVNIEPMVGRSSHDPELIYPGQFLAGNGSVAYSEYINYYPADATYEVLDNKMDFQTEYDMIYGATFYDKDTGKKLGINDLRYHGLPRGEIIIEYICSPKVRACDRMNAIMRKLEEELAGQFISIEWVDQDEAKYPEVKKLPTIFKYMDGIKTEYKGLADYNDVRTFILGVYDQYSDYAS